MVDGVWKGVYSKVFGRSKQLSQNKFFDQSMPSMRKVYNGEKEEKKREKRMLFKVATNDVVARTPTNRNADCSFKKNVGHMLCILNVGTVHICFAF